MLRTSEARMGESSSVTCPTCGAEFEYTAMAPREPGEDVNTQFDWLVSGRCPKCNNTVSLSFDQLQEIVKRLETEED